MHASDPAKSLPPHKIGILLIDGFALMAYASVIEPFRAANVLSGSQLYHWRHVSVSEPHVVASNGAHILADSSVGEPLDVDTLFVIMGGDPASFRDQKTFSWLRRLARSGVRLAGVSGGPYALARAGLLEGYRCTIHWDHVPIFLETFPTHMLEDTLYVIDRNRLTCAGGTAGLDLVIDFIEREHGHALAVEISEWFIRTQPRPAGDAQRMSLRERYNISNPRLLKVLARMEATLEEPDGRERLARIAGVSPRQLERLAKRHLKTTLGEMYRRIRLDHASVLLRKTGMSVTQVAIASGFTSTSHFSRCYKARFGTSPRTGRLLT
jgi:transcriptional regulator GlxA family with amidase domain